MCIYVYNYNTAERVKVIGEPGAIGAHSDYIRSIDVHPTLPYIISSSDDMSVKLWDWEKVIPPSCTSVCIDTRDLLRLPYPLHANPAL